jgi:polyhydroxybutyrate depolymerase
MTVRLAALAALALALLAGGCGGDEASGGPTGDALGPPQAAREAGDPCSVAPLPGSRSIKFLSSDHSRSAWIHLPAAPAGKRLPLVIAFHFAGASGREMESSVGLSPLADREQFVVLYPNAVAPSHVWALTERDQGDDLAITNNLLNHVEATVCIDPTRVYATGVSNGGGMAARAGCALSDRIAAIAPVAGGYRGLLDPCKPDRPVSVLEIHGDADTVTPYDGRGASHAGSVVAYLAAWTARDGCGAGPARRARPQGVVQLDWSRCDQGVAVRHLRLPGTTHGWPGSGGPLPRRDPSGISADREVWRFFKGRTVTEQDR